MKLTEAIDLALLQSRNRGPVVPASQIEAERDGSEPKPDLDRPFSEVGPAVRTKLMDRHGIDPDESFRKFMLEIRMQGLPDKLLRDLAAFSAPHRLDVREAA